MVNVSESFWVAAACASEHEHRLVVGALESACHFGQFTEILLSCCFGILLDHVLLLRGPSNESFLLGLLQNRWLGYTFDLPAFAFDIL